VAIVRGALRAGACALELAAVHHDVEAVREELLHDRGRRDVLVGGREREVEYDLEDRDEGWRIRRRAGVMRAPRSVGQSSDALVRTPAPTATPMMRVRSFSVRSYDALRRALRS
jgi:hypothetical protein